MNYTRENKETLPNEIYLFEPQENNEIVIGFSKTWRQSLASFITLTLVILVGFNMVYSSILLPQLKNSNEIKTNAIEESWVASLATVTVAIGSLACGPLADKFGRKSICISTGLILLISLEIIANANTIHTIYLGRFLFGIASGFTTTCVVYVSEITIPEIRSVLLCFNSVFVSFGILLASFLSLWLHWRLIARVFQALTIITIISIASLPESPHWFYTFKNDIVSVKKSLKWLNKDNYLYKRELNKFKEQRNVKNNNIQKNIFQLIKQKSVYKPLIILIIIAFLQEATGSYSIIFYAVKFFEESKGTFKNFNEFFSLVLLSCIRFTFAIIAAYISRNYGRKPLLIISSIGMAFTSCLTVISLFIYNGTNNIFAIFTILSYIAFASLGVLVIPWILIGELLPIEARSKFGGILVAISYLFMFTFIKTWLVVLSLIKIQGIFTMYSICSILFALFTYVYLPETFSKRIEDIENYFNR